MVFTPMTQIAVRGGFSSHDQVSPYGQTLRGFMPLPIADWSLVFKPQLWGYWILPPANAYSLYWAVLWCSMVVGYSMLLRQCGVSAMVAWCGSSVLWMSHYVQVWWTGPAAVFALAPWPAVVFLANIRPMIKWVLIPYVMLVWALAVVYPPYQIPTAFGLIALAYGLRRDAFKATTLMMGVVGVVTTLAISYIYLHDVIEVMRSTVYPGARISSGGGVASVQLLAHLLPYVSTRGFSSLVPRVNDCEVAVVASALPALLLVCLDYSSVRKDLKTAKVPLMVIGGALLMMLAWMTLPVPSSVGRVLLWNHVPAGRMIWAFGMLLTLSSIVAFARCRVTLTPARLTAFCLMMLLSWFIGEGRGADAGLQRVEGGADWFEFAAIGVAVAAWALIRLRPRDDPQFAKGVIAASAVVMGALTFGTFNPIQPAHVIFNIPPSARQAEFKEQASNNPNGWLITSGMYGAILNGAGIPSINHCLATPQMDFFRAVFPDLPEPDFVQIFNRYCNVMARPDPAPRLLQSDAVIVPIEPFERPQPKAVEVGRRMRRWE